jgi:hypothetical protein
MRSILVLTILAALPVSAADTQPFAPEPLQLESSRVAQPVSLDAPASSFGVRLDLPIGPIRVNYGTSVFSSVQSILSGMQSDAPRKSHLLDAPGTGYREQRTRTNNK